MDSMEDDRSLFFIFFFSSHLLFALVFVFLKMDWMSRAFSTDVSFEKRKNQPNNVSFFLSIPAL